jgi:hypothetical protein
MNQPGMSFEDELDALFGPTASLLEDDAPDPQPPAWTEPMLVQPPPQADEEAPALEVETFFF